MVEPVRLLAWAPQLWAAPSGDGSLVVDLPGYRAPEVAMAPLRSFLRVKGYDARGWGMGVNMGNPDRLRFEFVERLEPMVEEAGMPAQLVAWSLGGVVAREAARLRPDLVKRVVVFGAPLIGGPSFTVVGRDMDPEQCAQIAQKQRDADESDPVQVPVISIFSRNDGVVDWRASMDRYSAQTLHIEVGSTHGGLSLDPHVWTQITAVLASEIGMTT